MLGICVALCQPKTKRMKTIFLFILLCICGITTQAQDWCHQGSKWQYYGYSLGANDIAAYVYVKDTTLNSYLCHQLSFTDYVATYVTGNHYNYDTTQKKYFYTYSAADTTYFYFANFNKWLPVYFWAAQVGDTLLIPNLAFYGASDSAMNKVVVDSAGISLIDTNHLRYYSFHLLDSCGYQFQGKAVERLGMMDNDIVPFWHCITDDHYYSLCSYQDDSFAVYPSGGCPSLPTSINEINAVSFKVQPNPAQDEITISIDGSLTGAILSISNIDGRNIHNTQLISTDNKISVSDLANGLYILTISQNRQQAISRKLLIAR